MTTHSNTEDQLVEQPTIGLFAELGWTTVSALGMTLLLKIISGEMLP
jgi:type I restriction enzyme, R subunit